MSTTESQIAREIRQSPEVVRLQEQRLTPSITELVALLRRRPPQVVVTCARGSSAHAAAFAKHLIELYLGIPVAPAAPSVVSVYQRSLQLKDQLFLAVSQSGQSDDLIALAKSAKAGGAITVAVTNVEGSPLASCCDIILPICAGPELSVAATKSFIATATALARLTAAWSQNQDLVAALDRLPQRLSDALTVDWSGALPLLADAMSLVTIGRGATLAIAREAALKLKEICNRHAEAFSGAEFLHGPVSLVSFRYPIVLFMPTDAAAPGMRRLAEDLRRMGTALFVAEPGDRAAGRLRAIPKDQPELDAICLIQSFYAMAVHLAARLEIDADRPRHLNKVTRTT
jgi:glutamine---fructose-6-phosphate transaminase (isomerizing)